MQKKKKQLIIMIVILCIISGCSKGSNSNNSPTISEVQQEINTLMQAGDTKYLSDDYVGAKEKYDEVIELDENYIDAYINNARVAIKLEKYNEADNNLRKARQLLTNNLTAPYYDVVAELAASQNKRTEALEALNNAIAIETTTVRLSNRGQVFYLLHQNEKAKEDLQQVIGQTEGQIFENYYYLAEIAIYEGDFFDAEKHITKMLEKAPSNSEAPAMQSYINIKKIINDETTLTWEQKNELETEAEKHITIAKEKFASENNAITANYIGLYHYVKEELEVALEFYDKAIELDNKEASFYNNRALVYYMLGDTETSYQDMSEAIKLDNLEPEYYLGRGYILITREQRESAIGDFSRAVELDENYIKRIPNEYHDELPQSQKSGGESND